MGINFDRGLTRPHLVFWALWLAYLLLRLPVSAHLLDWPHALFSIGLLGIFVPGMLFFAFKWVGAGFKAER